MNENTEKQLELAIKKGLELAEKGGEFVVDQAPELLREFYLWHTTLDVVIILITLPLLIASIYCLYKWVNDSSTWSDYEGIGIASIFTGIGSSVFLIGFGLDLVKILITPKLYLIEYFIH